MCLNHLRNRTCITYTCVLHNHNVPNDNPFTCFSAVKGGPSEKLSYLHKIRDWRLAEPFDSTHRMKDVCDLLPDSLEGLELEKTGYHRRCYQDFTMSLHRLKNPSTDGTTEPSTSQRHHSPRKKIAAGADHVKFPPDECMFCEKNEIKANGKMQRPTNSFAAWKGKEPGWKKIESMG